MSVFGGFLQDTFVFLREVKAEIKKILWPKKDEMIGSVVIVLVFVAFFAVVLGLMDNAFATLIQNIIVWSRG